MAGTPISSRAGSDGAYAFTTHATHASLRPWIVGAWEFTAGRDAPGTHHVPPDGRAFVVLVERAGTPPLLMGQGPQVVPLVVPTSPGARFRGLRLTAEAAPLLLGVPAADLVRGRVMVAHIGPVPAGDIVAALTAPTVAHAASAADRLFLPLIDRLPVPEPCATRALERIHHTAGREPLAQVASGIGVSPRTMLRRVRDATGLAPKQHARIARFYSTAQGLLQRQSLSEVAATGGYADQPHFHHEVAALTGLTPAQLAERVRRTEHRLDDDRFPQDGERVSH